MKYLKFLRKNKKTNTVSKDDIAKLLDIFRDSFLDVSDMNCYIGYSINQDNSGRLLDIETDMDEILDSLESKEIIMVDIRGTVLNRKDNSRRMMNDSINYFIDNRERMETTFRTLSNAKLILRSAYVITFDGEDGDYLSLAIHPIFPNLSNLKDWKDYFTRQKNRVVKDTIYDSKTMTKLVNYSIIYEIIP